MIRCEGSLRKSLWRISGRLGKVSVATTTVQSIVLTEFLRYSAVGNETGVKCVRDIGVRAGADDIVQLTIILRKNLDEAESLKDEFSF
jgi:hypothetical protein